MNASSTTNSKARRFLAQWLASALAAAVLIIGIPLFAEFGQVRNHPAMHTGDVPYEYRYSDLMSGHALQAARAEFDLAVLGNSRVGNGFNGLKDFPEVFPAALPGASLEEMFALLKAFRLLSGTREIWIGADFGTFHFQTGAGGRLPDLTGGGRLIHILQIIAASSQLRAPSHSILKLLARNMPARTGVEFEAHYAKGLKGHRDSNGRGLLERRMETLNAIVAWSKDHGVRLKVFIHPVNIRELELLRLTGFQETEEAWKRRLCELACGDGSSHVELWDFSDYAYATAKPDPQNKGYALATTQYFDATHYSPKVGHILFHAMRGATAPPPWGRKLSHESLDRHLKNSSRLRAEYAQRFPGSTAATYSKARSLMNSDGRGK